MSDLKIKGGKRTLIFLISLAFILCLISANICLAQQAGTYEGSYSGDDNGIWVAAIDSAGEGVFLSYSTQDSEGDGGFLDYIGSVGVVDTYNSNSEINGTNITANVNTSTGAVSGNWSNPFSNDTGL